MTSNSNVTVRAHSQSICWSGMQPALRRALGPSWQLSSIASLLGGHAGTTFELLARNESGDRRRFAVKCAPVGVTRSGAADVCRQVPLLRVLYEFGLPVPRIVWSDDTGDDIGTSYVVFDWVDGQQHFPVVENKLSPSDLPAELWGEAATLLARLHDTRCAARLEACFNPIGLDAEVLRWEATLRKSPQPSWITLGLEALSRLLATQPVQGATGVVHGDYQPSNLMVRNGAISAVIDWDMATLGDPMIDLGWLLMWANPANWQHRWHSRCGVPIATIADAYFVARDLPRAPLGWYEGLAAYRFASITCLNVRLHRNGRRPDAVWERFADDVPHLFARAAELAGSHHG